MKSRILQITLLFLIMSSGPNLFAYVFEIDTVDILLQNIMLTSSKDTVELTGNIKLFSYGQATTKEGQSLGNYLIPILLGLFAGLIALYQVKLNNITAAKIKWIEQYRNALSSYLTNIDSSATDLLDVMYIQESEKPFGEEDKKYYDFYEKYSISTKLADRDYLLIKLLVKKNNQKFNKFELQIDELDTLYGEVKGKENMDKLRDKIKECIYTSQDILSDEWKAVEKSPRNMFKEWVN